MRKSERKMGVVKVCEGIKQSQALMVVFNCVDESSDD